MIQQNYNAEDAFARWRPTGLLSHLQRIRQAYRRTRLLASPARDLDPSDREVTGIQRWLTTKFGVVTWGVFTRAFWPIYQKGTSPLFFGSLIISCVPEDEDAPSLFEVAEEVRQVRDYDVPVDGIEEFAEVIRDDYSKPMRVAVPERIAMRSGFFLQSIGIERRKLPDGYLHHRLVPVITHPRYSYASIIHQRFWGEEFTAIWRSSERLLTDAELKRYQEAFPEIVP